MSTALLILDLSTCHVIQLPSYQEYITHFKTTISAARSKNVKIIFVHLSFRSGHPEISSTNMMFSKILGTDKYVRDIEETNIHPDLGCDEEKGDVIVTKRRISAFCGSDLEVLLRGLGVRKVVLGGLVTSGTVLGTAFEASDRDFEVTVLRDCCRDRQEDLNQIILDRILSKMATVVDSETWLQSLSEAGD